MVFKYKQMYRGYFIFSEMFVCSITSREESFQLLQCHPGYKAICSFVIITEANIESKHLYLGLFRNRTLRQNSF